MLVLGSVIFYLIDGFGFLIIYLMLWIDKVIFGELRSPLYFGLDFYSLPSILIGIAYGPLSGFLFGFLVVPIVWGMIDLIYTLLLGGHLVDTGWELFFPSPESLITGLIAVVAGIFSPHLPFIGIVLTCMVLRFVMSIARDVTLEGSTNLIAYFINVGLTVFIAIALQNFFVTTFYL